MAAVARRQQRRRAGSTSSFGQKSRHLIYHARIRIFSPLGYISPPGRRQRVVAQRRADLSSISEKYGEITVIVGR
jgi:hypothetical protein